MHQWFQTNKYIKSSNIYIYIIIFVLKNICFLIANFKLTLSCMRTHLDSILQVMTLRTLESKGVKPHKMIFKNPPNTKSLNI